MLAILPPSLNVLGDMPQRVRFCVRLHERQFAIIDANTFLWFDKFCRCGTSHQEISEKIDAGPLLVRHHVPIVRLRLNAWVILS